MILSFDSIFVRKLPVIVDGRWALVASYGKNGKDGFEIIRTEKHKAMLYPLRTEHRRQCKKLCKKVSFHIRRAEIKIL